MQICAYNSEYETNQIPAWQTECKSSVGIEKLEKEYGFFRVRSQNRKSINGSKFYRSFVSEVRGRRGKV